MPEVFPLDVWYPLKHEMRYATHVVDFGDGFEQRVNKNLSFGPRADGEGNLVSYKGLSRFTINIDNMAHVNASTTDEANLLWAFYKARLGNFEAFYFYNPAENTTIDLTGLNETGRYLVRFEDAGLSSEMLVRKLFQAGIGFWRQ
jgi:phage-related protein